MALLSAFSFWKTEFCLLLFTFAVSAVYAEIMSSRRSFSFSLFMAMYGSRWLITILIKVKQPAFHSQLWCPISHWQWEKFCIAMTGSIWSIRKNGVCAFLSPETWTIGVLNSLKQFSTEDGASTSVSTDAVFVQPHNIVFAISKSGKITGINLLAQLADLFEEACCTVWYMLVTSTTVVLSSYLLWDSVEINP